MPAIPEGHGSPGPKATILSVTSRNVRRQAREGGLAVVYPAPRVAEFFAGIGLVRMALEREGCRVVFANDISVAKQQLYAANFGSTEYLQADIRTIRGRDVPDVEIATASFPCTDLSLAGARAGLNPLVGPRRP